MSYRVENYLLTIIKTISFRLDIYSSDRDDDWRTPDGIILDPPSSDLERLFSRAYDYCRQNWCAQDSGESLFQYGTGESFADINKCNVDFSTEIEDAFINIMAESDDNALYQTCGGNVACLVDGLCGDENDAQSALVNEQIIVSTKEEVNANIFLAEEVEVEDVTPVTPETDSSTTTTTGTTTSTTTSTTTEPTTSATTSTGTTTGITTGTTAGNKLK